MDLLDRLTAARWPALAGLVAGGATFLGVLLVTPPGLAAPWIVLVGRASEPGFLSASYAASAASTLGLLALLGVSGLAAAAELAIREVLPRLRGRRVDGPTDPDERPTSERGGSA